MKTILSLSITATLISVAELASANSGLVAGNVGSSLSYTYCQSETSGNYFVKFNAYPKRKIQTYSMSQVTGKLQPLGRDAVILSGEKVGDEYRENAIYATNDVIESRSEVSDGRVSRFVNLSTLEEGWGLHGTIIYDAGNDRAEVLNEFEGTSEKFTCSVIGNTDAQTRDYITGVFERYESRLGFVTQPKVLTESEEKRVNSAGNCIAWAEQGNYMLKTLGKTSNFNSIIASANASINNIQSKQLVNEKLNEWRGVVNKGLEDAARGNIKVKQTMIIGFLAECGKIFK